MKIAPKDMGTFMDLVGILYLVLLFLSFGALSLWSLEAKVARMNNKDSLKARLIDRRWKRIAWVTSSFLLIPMVITVLELVIKAPFEAISGLRRFIAGKEDN
ncbi:MAG: hypothetical protein M0Z61_07810 [Nitrospiraceae bacterium]|nr:hypothetical protein [Nitrospiraceae bacterium]